MKKSDVFKHFILTRYNTQHNAELGHLYDDPDEADIWMESRIDLFEKTKESVLSQEGDFEWIVSVDNRTPKKFLKKIFTDDRMRMVHCDIRDTFKDVEIDVPWVITTRLDNDDQYKPGAIKAIQSRFEPKLKVIDIGFNELDWPTGDEYLGERRWPNSMFISLIEPSSRIVTAFCRPHGQVYTEYPMSGSYDTKWGDLKRIGGETIEKKYALMVCHGGNITNRVRGKKII